VNEQNNIINIDKDILSNDEIEYIKVLAKKPIFNKVIMSQEYFDKAITELKNDYIINKILSYLYEKYNMKLICKLAQIQTWVPDSVSEEHIHRCGGRDNTEYNFIIYLNDDYEGGELFLPDYGIKIKPIKGLSVLFNGKNIKHGVTKIKKSNRYGLILWCSKTN
jgi:hypothetical protein